LAGVELRGVTPRGVARRGVPYYLPKSRPHTVMASALAVAALSVALFLGSPVRAQSEADLAPLDLILQGDLDTIEREATRGLVEAQYAMSVVSAHALLGQPLDPAAAAQWRRAASTSGQSVAVDVTRIGPDERGLTRGRSQPVAVDAVVRRYDLAVNLCLGLLYGLNDRSGACGQDATERARRVSAWQRLRQERVR